MALAHPVFLDEDNVLPEPTSSRTDSADLPPSLARAILIHADRLGASTDRLCRGLGFRPDDLQHRPDVKVSYRQTSALVHRFRRTLGKQASGIAVGLHQTPLSWGLPGFAMLACRNLGEAAQYCLSHQVAAGAAITHVSTLDAARFVIELVPRFADAELEVFLVEEGFASILSVVRCLTGPQFRPERLELAYPEPANAAEYVAAFGCPITFGAAAHRMTCHPKWLACQIQTYDPLSADLVRGQLSRLLAPQQPQQQSDFLAGATNFIRTRVDRPITLEDLAQDLNMSARTASRRLVEHGVTFQTLLDQVRCEHARRLLESATVRIDDVAAAVGYTDPSNFRRAYKRWTGCPPRQGGLSAMAAA